MSQPIPPVAKPRRASKRSPKPVTSDKISAATLPIVGIGCSAGVLEALEKFLRNVPADSGMAFVIVQHLDPLHDSALPSLLQRYTPLRVVEVEDGMTVEADCVFVIPPNKDLSLLHGRLRLLEPFALRGRRLPIDFFLRSLAEDRLERAIGVVLSGMGSDGVLGLRAIKEKGGLTLVQEPLSAQSESMPRSAIEAGVVDIIARAEDLPQRIRQYLCFPLYLLPREHSGDADASSALDQVIILLRERSGNDFSLYKANTLNRRIERRMAVHQLSSIKDYVLFLRGNLPELDLLFKELLIGVTRFFRDHDVWESLASQWLPELLAQNPNGQHLRAWVAACSTGEEAYTLAIVFREALEKLQPSAHFTLQIYATDLDAEAINRARKGYYPANIAADISPERLARFFVPADGGYLVGKNIREMVVFATQNITSDPPFTKLDIISCRNLLIYFGAQLQKKLLSLFYYALNRNGLLLLGNSESIGNFGNLFAPLNSKARIFSRIGQQTVAGLQFPARPAPYASLPLDLAHIDPADNLGQLTDHLIQQTWAPAAVLVNADGDILYFSGRTGKYLEPAAGKTNINIHAMARDGLRQALTGVIRKSLQDAQPVFLNGLRIGAEEDSRIVDVVVQNLDRPEALRGRVLIVFKDVPAVPPRRRSGKKLAVQASEELLLELDQTRQALQLTHEEMQTAVEELKSSSEELQSTNEELQSTNEELTTSKEELQSLNEEQLTVNAELQSKVDDLTWVRNDMVNLLNSTEIPTIFLDSKLQLRRFTSHATRLFKVISGDIGRPLAHIVTDLDYAQLGADAAEVLSTLIFCEKPVATFDGRWYRVRIMPYRTQDNVIDGVVITFIDITLIKQLEAQLRERSG